MLHIRKCSISITPSNTACFAR